MSEPTGPINQLLRRARRAAPAAAAVAPLARVPQHLAIIMDGNGRWAKRRGLPRIAGHKAGTENLRRILNACAQHEIKVLTLYAFSTENWSRPEDEVSGLMRILEGVLTSEIDKLDASGVQIRHIGRIDRVPTALQNGIREAIARTRNNSRIVLNVALNYGGRAEIVDAVKQMMRDNLDPDSIDEGTISRYLYTRDLPDPDLVIRTSGEYRTSNFLTWQSAYAEYYITDVYWPDFDEAELLKALQHFALRERRYGGVTAK
jgi:undecaprenyl diphosphate synthase